MPLPRGPSILERMTNVASFDETFADTFRRIIREEVRPMIREEMRPIIREEVKPLYEKIEQIRYLQLDGLMKQAALKADMDITKSSIRRLNVLFEDLDYNVRTMNGAL